MINLTSIFYQYLEISILKSSDLTNQNIIISKCQLIYYLENEKKVSLLIIYFLEYEWIYEMALCSINSSLKLFNYSSLKISKFKTQSNFSFSNSMRFIKGSWKKKKVKILGLWTLRINIY
jgi:hypothetical protein